MTNSTSSLLIILTTSLIPFLTYLYHKASCKSIKILELNKSSAFGSV